MLSTFYKINALLVIVGLFISISVYQNALTLTNATVPLLCVWFSKCALQYFPLSVIKTIFNDVPLLIFQDIESLVYRVCILLLFYESRVLTKEFIMEFQIDKFSAGFAAGIIGGCPKYYLIGMSPFVGALNTMAYETCGNLDLCINNRYVHLPFVIILEIVDSILQGSVFYRSTAAGKKLSLEQCIQRGAKNGILSLLMYYFLYLPVINVESTN